MRLNVLIIPDKFKGTLLASQAAQAIARGWRRARPQDSLALLPMSDGGDGFGEVISKLLRAQVQTGRGHRAGALAAETLSSIRAGYVWSGGGAASGCSTRSRPLLDGYRRQRD